MMGGKPVAVVALGGNAVLQRGEKATASRELSNIEKACEALTPFVADFDLIITHGNGPQVGNLLIRMEECATELPPMPLDVCVAQTQGELGYFLQEALGVSLKQQGLRRQVCSVLTQVVVAVDDPAFTNPTKPVGPFFTQEQAQLRARERGWVVAEDSGRGFRRVVPSPRPCRVVEADIIANLVRSGVVVIAGGGGGIPVVELPNGHLAGVEAVIDKDLTASLLACAVRSSLLVILTSVDRVYLNYQTSRQRSLSELALDDARRYLTQGQFAPGSMGPKIEAAIHFLEQGSGEVLITDSQHLSEALAHHAGTWITSEAIPHNASRSA